jgi:hypothetical protein
MLRFQKRINMFSKYTITYRNSNSKGFNSMIKKSIITICLGVSTLSAGFLDSIKSEVVNAVINGADKKVENSTNKNVRNSTDKKVGNGLSVRSSSSELGKRRVPPSSSQSSKGRTSIKLCMPDRSLVELTECTNLKLSNIILGYDGTYTFKNGFKKEKRTGFIKRKKVKISNRCILPSLNPSQIAYFEVDTKEFKALGSSNDWSMQCIKSANPDAGALGEKESRSEYGKVGYLTGKYMMLHCGNSEGIKECVKGSNSSRSRAWTKKLKKSGKTMISVHATKSQLAVRGGEKLYCQYYNSKSGKSLFAFEYIRTRL